MRSLRPTLLALAVLAAFPAAAQSNQELLDELRALKARVADLEKKLDAQAGAAAPAQGQAPQWGMTPEQSAELARVTAKTEGLQDGIEAQGLKDLKISGYIEPAFIYNQRQNRAGFQFLNQQSDGFAYDTSYIGSAVIDFTKETDSGTIWKLTLSPNRGVGAALDGKSIIQEASVTVPLEGGHKLIAGQVPDWSGYEYQQPTLNPFTSHNLLYDFTLPTAYTGVGMIVPAGKWTWKAMLANVNKPIHAENQRAPGFVFRGDYELSEFSGIGVAGLVGNTTNYNTGSATLATLLEVDGFHTRGDWTLQGQIAYGQQRGAAITPDAEGHWRDAQWWGVSATAGYMLNPRLQGLVRADYIVNSKNGGGLFGYTGYTTVDEASGEWVYGNDGRNGIGPDLNSDLNRGANRYALTLGLKYMLAADTTLKFEYRLDGADRPVFLDASSGDHSRTNHMLATSLVVAF